MSPFHIDGNNEKKSNGFGQRQSF